MGICEPVWSSLRSLLLPICILGIVSVPHGPGLAQVTLGTLYADDRWEVSLETLGTNYQCQLATIQGNRLLTLSTSDAVGFTFTLIGSGQIGNGLRTNVELRIDEFSFQADMRAQNLSGEKFIALFEPGRQEGGGEFLSRFASGSRLQAVTQDGTVAGIWSLRGSRQALSHLVSCGKALSAS